ncbi:MAG: bifunctional alpha,alpha-trehalose-phosphate synthase (UDP-forming)/trehalose-phosphatase [Candidatus Brocadiia bacterium]|nr:MAG: bifunctional alpha,alpha-trehalose-phosphate synthase (UDP-forming)/trehalose-phosphatase [Candidatus Brocadiia bacterium]
MRTLIISNRLPVSAKVTDGHILFSQSSGGLVSGLSAYLESLQSSSFVQKDYLWIGWPGITVDDSDKEKLTEDLFTRFRAHPVFLSENVMDNFYHGFCNKIIWPLFHYFPSYVIYDDEYWKYYKNVNQAFCDSVIDLIQPGDIVWVQDYHLMLLPEMIRRRKPDVSIGFFLHIPFPGFELFRLLPKTWRTEILQGILGADLIGFHAHDYTQYFLRCILRLLGYEHNIGEVITSDRIIKVDTFPMGIHFKRFNDASDSPDVAKERRELKKSLKDNKVILSIDRLDYTKGIVNRLKGYELFLRQNPDWHGKVILVVIVVPSRVAIERYQNIKKQINELIGDINSKFGSIHWTPISYQYKNLDFDNLVALYTVSDVALVTPLRDGMNLIAKEYLACRTDNTGSLIISEMAGAAKELGEAIIVNPNHQEEIAEAIKKALELPKDQQIAANDLMRNRLASYDVIKWADEFIQTLLAVKNKQSQFNARFLETPVKTKLLEDFKNASQRIIFLDYDGTVVPFEGNPALAKPTKEVLDLIDKLSSIKKTKVVIVSGRDKDTLQNWLGGLNIAMVAEHGVWFKSVNKNWTMPKTLKNDWKEKIMSICGLYVDRLPGSLIEEKDYSIAWHYRRCEPELASIRAKEFMDDLVSMTANIDVQILQGSKVIEIRNVGVSKSAAALHYLSENKYDFILAIGDDWTDEELFKAVPLSAYSIKVGMTCSYARFNLHNYKEVLDLIKDIINFCCPAT